MILITGYKGFIGSTYLNKLITNGRKVKGFEWGDNLNLDNISTVIHLGAISSTTEKDVNKILTQNYDFSVNLINECIKRNINLQYASSASVYGHGQIFNEEAQVDPKTPYAWSKYLIERYATSKIREGVNIRIQGFRYFNVWGDSGEEHKDQPSPYTKFRMQAEKQGHIELFEGSENYKRDFINVNNIILLHEKFLKVPLSGIWNFGTGKPKSFYEVAKEVASKYSCKIKYIPMPHILKDSYQSYTCADMTKTNKDLLKYEKDFDNGAPGLR